MLALEEVGHRLKNLGGLWFQIGKEYIKAVYCHPAYLTCIMRNAGLEEAQAGIKIARRNINNLRYADDTTLMAKSEEELKAQHSEDKDHGIWSHHFMGNRWGNSGNCQTLFLGAPKSLQMVTVDMKLKDDYSLEEKL